MNLKLLGYLRLYKAIRALIVYRYLYEIYKNYQENLYQSESSFSDLAAWDNQSTQKIEQGGDTAKPKTATGVENFLPENAPGLEQPESPNCIGFEAVFIYDLRPINLYYFRARYYDPIMGRFLSVDPMGYRDSMNLYQAFNVNPVNFVDPWGLTTVIINIVRTRINSQSVTGEYYVELKDLFNDIGDFTRNFVDGHRIYQRSRRIRGVTLERLWVENQKNVSAIPTGSYELGLTYSGQFRRRLPEFLTVPGNRNYDYSGNSEPIRIHPGNQPSHSTGCILLGTSYNPSVNSNWISRSLPKVTELMNFINDVERYDRRRGENTKIYANIRLDTESIFSNYISGFISGVGNLGFGQFVKALISMSFNQSALLNMMESYINSVYSILSPSQRIYFSTIIGAWIGRKPN